VGRWETLPLRTLEKALLDAKISDTSTLKVGFFRNHSTLLTIVRCQT
jgi:hypothetical protein